MHCSCSTVRGPCNNNVSIKIISSINKKNTMRTSITSERQVERRKKLANPSSDGHLRNLFALTSRATISGLSIYKFAYHFTRFWTIYFFIFDQLNYRRNCSFPLTVLKQIVLKSLHPVLFSMSSRRSLKIPTFSRSFEGRFSKILERISFGRQRMEA